MKFLQVNYARTLGSADPAQRERNRLAAEHISEVPGLIWKIWGSDDERGQAAGLYLFADETSARAWGEGPMRTSLAAMPGVSDIRASYFDVDEALSARTRGPLSAPDAAAQ